ESPYPLWVGAEPALHLYLLVPPEYPHATIAERFASWHRVDLAREEFVFNVNRPQSLPDSGLLLDHFEARFNDPQVRLGRLQLLETALLAEDRPVTIISAIDCVHYLETGGGTPAGEPADEEELKRWRRVMNHFEKRTVPRTEA